MLQITDKVREQLKAGGATDEEIDSLIAESDPLQKYNFNYKFGKIDLKDVDYTELADFFVTKYGIYKILKTLHIYREGLYVYLNDDEFDAIVINDVYNSKINSRKELRQYIKAQAKEKTPTPERYILFKNGVYDTKEDVLLEKSSKWVFCNMIPHDYNKDVTSQPIFDDFILSLVCGDTEAALLLKQMLGYCFYRKNPLQEFLFILGNGGNGKSTLLEFIAYIIGYDNVSYVTLEDMQDSFNLVLLKNKLLNIGDDVDFEYTRNVGVLKKIVSGEPFIAGGKYKDKEPMSFYGKTLFSGNAVPKMNDKSNGIRRRLNILPMLNNFKNSPNLDINILDKLKTEQVAEYAIKECLNALRDVLKHKRFVKPKTVEEANYSYAVSNNNVLEFIEEYESFITTKEAATVYTQYQNFCEQCGYKPIGRNMFYREMQNAGYVRKQVDGIAGRPRVFTPSKTQLFS